MKLNQIIRSYCQGKFHRIFLLLSVIGIGEVLVIVGTIKYFERDISSLLIFSIMSIYVLALAGFIASQGKHLFK